MPEAADLPFTAWESFYVIVGSSAAALTGLQFVVIALLVESDKPRTTAALTAFATPNIIHFSAALLISALLSAPWHEVSGAVLILGMSGAAGAAYVAIVIRKMRRQNDYQPVAEDWIWHAILPALAYVTLVVAGIGLGFSHDAPLFAIAAVSLLLLFIGIHNAWDTVTYIALGSTRSDRPTATP